ncbi:hypothetical protein PENSPDRAFT_303525 [Peniophora sp. CONT]|nr:hypothetical protein PENSPDRAFT_303525 [Peniophora sp. CONT]
MSSWHVANVAEASASLTFNGTGAWLYGANRPGYGQYNVIVDGNQAVTASAAADKDTFGVLLGGAGNLTYGEHTIMLVNTGSGPIDLDQVIFETMVGQEGDTLFTKTMGAETDGLTYTGAWTNSSVLVFTDVGGAQMMCNFSGDAVAIMGATSVAYGDYTVEVDGNVQSMSASANMGQAFAHEESLLYFSNNLGPGNHSLTFTANPGQTSNTGKYVGVTNVNVFSSLAGVNQANLNPTTTQQQDQPSASSLSVQPTPTLGNVDMNNSSQSSAPPSPIHFEQLIGAIAGFIGFFIVCSFAFVFWIRRRRVKRGDSEKLPEPPMSPRSFVQRPRSDATGAFGKPTISRKVLERAMEPMPPLPENPFEDPNPIPNPFRDPEKDSESMRTMSSSWSYHAPKGGAERTRASPAQLPYGQYRPTGHNPSDSASSVSSSSSTDALLGPSAGSSRVGVAV